MKLKKCERCKTYTLQEECKLCKKSSSEAHYKFIKIKDAPKTKKFSGAKNEKSAS